MTPKVHIVKVITDDGITGILRRGAGSGQYLWTVADLDPLASGRSDDVIEAFRQMLAAMPIPREL